MNAAPLHIGGVKLLLDPAGALLWPEHGLLAVADLHLEKSSHFAARGQLLPPFDSTQTLRRLEMLRQHWRPRIIVALGDSFHDNGGLARLSHGDAARLARLEAETRFIWVQGNHDSLPQPGLRGATMAEFRLENLVFRHAPQAATPQRPAEGRIEICGHLHPKARVPTRAASISRPCFVADARRVVLPAFGAYTGGLDIGHPAIAGHFPQGGRCFLLGQTRLFHFALGATARRRQDA